MDATAVATTPDEDLEDGEEEFDALENEAPNPFKGPLSGSPALDFAPVPGVDPRTTEHDSGGTRFVPVTPAESGVRQGPSAESLASVSARRAMLNPRLVEGVAAAPAPEVAPAIKVQLSEDPRRSGNALLAALAVITALAMLFLGIGSHAAGRQEHLQRELQAVSSHVESLRSTLSEVRAVNSRLKSALAYERDRPWWRRLNKWW